MYTNMSFTLINNSTELKNGTLHLGQPYHMTHSNYFSNLYFFKDGIKNFLCVRTPECIVKQRKERYIDLQFDNSYDEEFQTLLDNMEQECKRILLEKQSQWFEHEVDEESIDYLLTPLFRDYKKNNFLMRCYYERDNNGVNISIYDEQKNQCAIDSIHSHHKLICLLYFKGLKINANSITPQFIIKQILIKEKPDNLLDSFALCSTSNNDEKIPSPTIPQKSNETNETQPTIVDDLVEGVGDSDAEEDAEEEEQHVSFEVKEETVPETSMVPVEENDVEHTHHDEPKREIQENVDEESDFLEEVDLTVSSNSQPKTIQEPYEVFHSMYQKARLKAKQAKKEAILAYLKVKEIKNTYLIEDDYDESDDDLDRLSVMSTEELHQL